MWQPALTLGRKTHDKGLFANAEFFNSSYFLLFEVWPRTHAGMRDFFVIGFPRESLGSKGNMSSAVWCMRLGFDPGWTGICFSKGDAKGRPLTVSDFILYLTLWKQSRDPNPQAFITPVSAISTFSLTGQNFMRG